MSGPFTGSKGVIMYGATVPLIQRQKRSKTHKNKTRRYQSSIQVLIDTNLIEITYNFFLHYRINCRSIFTSMQCWYHILFALDLHVKPRKIQKYYFLSMGPQGHPEWCGTTYLDTGAPKVPFSTKRAKMPLVNLGLTKVQTRSKPSQNNTFIVLHQIRASRKFLETLTKFNQVDPELTPDRPQKP